MIWYLLLIIGIAVALWSIFAVWYLLQVSRDEGARVQRDRAGRIIAIVGTDTRRGIDGETFRPRRYR
jgi:hypothetical protein